MSNNYWDDEEDDVEVPDHQLSGDDLVKKLRKAKRADEKRIKELTEKLEGFVKEKREQTVSEVLAKKGVNAKAARLILKDVEDATEESIDSWLRDNGDTEILLAIPHRSRMKIRSKTLRHYASKMFLLKAD